MPKPTPNPAQVNRLSRELMERPAAPCEPEDRHPGSHVLRACRTHSQGLYSTLVHGLQLRRDLRDWLPGIAAALFERATLDVHRDPTVREELVFQEGTRLGDHLATHYASRPAALYVLAVALCQLTLTWFGRHTEDGNA